MARIRTVKPEFFQHEEIGALPFAARLLAIGLMQIADGHGRLRWVPKQIEAHVFPWDDIDLEPLAVGLESVGILVRYEVDGRSFGAFPNFRKHQRITGKEAAIPSKYPHHDDATTDEVNTQERPGETPRHAPGKHLDAQEQGTGNREQGTGNRSDAEAPHTPPSPRPKPAAKKPKRRRKIERYAPSPSPEVLSVYGHWHGKHPKADDRPDIDQDTLIQALLDGGYSVEDLSHVIDVTHVSDWHIREKKLGLDFCLRAAHVKERLSEFKERGATAAPVEAPPAERYPRWLEDAVMRKIYIEQLQPADLTVELLKQHPRIAEVSQDFQLKVIGSCFEQKGWKR